MCIEKVDYIQTLQPVSLRDVEFKETVKEMNRILFEGSPATRRDTFKVEFTDSSPDGYGYVEDVIACELDYANKMLLLVVEPAGEKRRVVVLNIAQLTSFTLPVVPVRTSAFDWLNND